LDIDTSRAWSLNTYCSFTEPVNTQFSTQYTYTRIYETKTKNEALGIAGIVCAGAGAYLVIDSVVGVNELAQFFKRHNLMISVARTDDTLGLRVSRHL
jgi:hypothetical protein